MSRLSNNYDEDTDVMEIHGIEYSGEVFRQLGEFLPIDTPFKLVKREDGVLTIFKFPELKHENGLWEPSEQSKPELCSEPALRQWAIEMAVKSEANYNGFQRVETVAQDYINYVLKGEK